MAHLRRAQPPTFDNYNEIFSNDDIMSSLDDGDHRGGRHGDADRGAALAAYAFAWLDFPGATGSSCS